MPVPSSISDLSQTAGSNSPLGGESPITADDYFRAHASFTALLRDGKGHSTEVDLASAATCDIGGQNSFMVRITGTTTITSFGTNFNGPRFIRFAGALTLTHNASTLILPGAANITTAAGDTCIATPISGGWVVSDYTRADGKVLVGALTSGTAATASGASIDFTDIPSWVKRITLSFTGLSTNGTSIPMIQIGDSGGLETSGYDGTSTQVSTTPTVQISAHSNGFLLNGVHVAAATYHGVAVLTLLSSATNRWAFLINLGRGESSTTCSFGAGSKALSATLDRIRLTTVGGSETFDAGSVNILYE